MAVNGRGGAQTATQVAMGIAAASLKLGSARCGRSAGVARTTSTSSAWASVGIKNVQTYRMASVGTIQRGTAGGTVVAIVGAQPQQGPVGHQGRPRVPRH